VPGAAVRFDLFKDGSASRRCEWRPAVSRCRLTCAWSCRALAWEELRCLANQPFFLRLHRLAPSGVAPAA